MGCDLCGKDGHVEPRLVEGVVYMTCADCRHFGSSVTVVHRKERTRHEEPALRLKEGFSSIIREARAAAGLDQASLASQLGIKSSVLASWESGSRRPTIEAARTVERKLRVSLVENDDAPAASYDQSPGSDAGLTIGDLIKRSSRK